MNVGLVANTKGPDPVSSVTADARFADDGVAKNVATPVPRPLTPVLIGNPVALVSVAADGVPKLGVTSVGEVANTRLPEPVSSVTAAAKLALDGVPSHVATPAPRPLMLLGLMPVQLVRLPLLGVPSAPLNVTNAPADPTLTARAVRTPVPVPVRPVEIGRPVAFVSVPLLGVPSAGLTSVGLVARTMLPEPVVVLPSAVTVPLVGNVSDVEPENVKVASCAPDVMKLEPSASVSVALVAGAVIVTLLTLPFRAKLPLLSTTKEAVDAPVTVKLSSLEDESAPVLVTANLMPFHVVVTSFQVSVRL